METVTISSVQVNIKNLVKVITAAKSAIAKNAVVPIIESLLIKIENGNISAYGTDLQTTVHARISEHSGESICFLCSPRVLNFLKGLKDECISIFREDNSVVLTDGIETLKYDQPESELKDFPRIPDLKSEELISDVLISSDELSHVMMMAKDQESSKFNNREEFENIYAVPLTDNRVGFLVLSPYKGARMDIMNRTNTQNTRFGLSRRCAYILKNILPPSGYMVQLEVYPENLRMVMHHDEMSIGVITRQPEDFLPEHLPGYFIPSDKTIVTGIAKDEFLRMLTKAKADHDGRIKLVIDEAFTIQSLGSDKAFAVRQSGIAGLHLKINFIQSHLKKLMEMVTTETFTLHFGSDEAGVIVKDSPFTWMLMPARN